MMPEQATSKSTLKTDIRQGVSEVLSDPLSWPDQFAQNLANSMEVNPPGLLLSQILGFSTYKTGISTSVSALSAAGVGFSTSVAALSADIVTLQTYGPQYDARQGSTFISLSPNTTWTFDTDSPRLVDVAAGSYFLGFGCEMLLVNAVTESLVGQIGVGINGADPASADLVATAKVDTFAGRVTMDLMSMFQYTASAGDDLEMYAQTTTSGATNGISYYKSWLLAYRYA